MPRWMLCAGAALGLGVFGSDQAAAQNNLHTWIDRTGSDGAGCGAIASPCRSLAVAIGQTAAGGEVECLNAVDLGNFNINKTITITCDGPKLSNSTGAGIGTGAIISVAQNDVVTLRGLNFDGAGITNMGLGQNGVIVFGAGTLVLDNVKFSGWTASGVQFQPSGVARLIVSNSLFARNGSGTTGAGIRVVPSSGGSAFVSITNSTFSGNVFGFAADTTASGAGGVNAGITDSMLAGNRVDGIVAVAGASGAGVVVDFTRVMDNGANGLRAIGANAVIRVGRSTIKGNGTGVASVSGGQMLTSQSNVVEGNAVDGAFTGTFAPK